MRSSNKNVETLRRDPTKPCSEDTDWIDFIGERHQKTEEEIDAMIVSDQLQSKTAEEMHELVDGYDCEDYIILITGWDEDDDDDDEANNMIIQTIPIPNLRAYSLHSKSMFIATVSARDTFNPFYSFHNLAIFLYIFKTFADLERIDFYKARENGRVVTVFKVYEKGSGAPVYSGNLSGLP